MLPTKLTLEVVTPDRDVVRDDVDFVQMPGLDGYLGVLPGHAPLLTELGTGLLSFRSGGVEHYAALAGGFAEVLGDRVIVLAEVAELGEDIDVMRAQAAQERALKIIQQKAEKVDFSIAQSALERSLVRIEAAKLAGQGVAGMKHRPRGIAGGEQPHYESSASSAEKK
jgi:F-type H+-transporting ATPase subunit epsilon